MQYGVSKYETLLFCLYCIIVSKCTVNKNAWNHQPFAFAEIAKCSLECGIFWGQEQRWRFRYNKILTINVTVLGCCSVMFFCGFKIPIVDRHVTSRHVTIHRTSNPTQLNINTPVQYTHIQITALWIHIFGSQHFATRIPLLHKRVQICSVIGQNYPSCDRPE
jgi:hypothetical protein